MKQEIWHGDCLELMKDIPDGSVDAVICDPPYFNVSKAEYDYIFKDKESYKKWMIEWSLIAFDKLKEGGAFYCFGGIGPKNGFVFWNYVEELSNYQTFLSYINWKRFKPKGYKGKHNNWGDCREDIAYFCKGKGPKIFTKQYLREAGLSSASKKRFEQTGVGLACGNIWIDIPEAQLDGGMNRTLKHPDMKPILLMERIISASTSENDIVLDCFAGSGTTGLAAKNLNRQFIGVEKEKEYYDICVERLKTS